MVATPTDITAATRSPATIAGSATGSSTMNSRCARVMPMPRAASISAGSTLSRPVAVLRTMGSCE